MSGNSVDEKEEKKGQSKILSQVLSIRRQIATNDAKDLRIGFISWPSKALGQF